MKTIKRATQAVVAILMILFAGQAYALETLHYVDKSAIQLAKSSNNDGWFSWDSTNTKIHIAYTLFHIVDWKQTRYAARHPDEFYEINPAMGKHPSIKTVDTYMGLSYLGVTGITFTLPSKLSHGFQYGVGFVKIVLVGHNLQVGVDINF